MYVVSGTVKRGFSREHLSALCLAPHMSRLTTRQAAAGKVDGLGVNPFAALPRDIVLCDLEAGFKREHELGVYAELRSSMQSTSVEELSAGALKWLSPRDGEVAGGRSLPPRALQTARATGAAAVIVLAVNEAIRDGDWHELALILKQVELCHDSLHRAKAELPWWELASRTRSAQAEVHEHLDLTRDDELGGKDNPLDPSTVGQLDVKIEPAGSSSTDGLSACSHKRGAEEAELRNSHDSDDSDDADSEYQRVRRAVLGPIAQPHESHFQLQIVSKSGLRSRKAKILEQLEELRKEIAEIDSTLESPHAVSDGEIDKAETSEDEDWVDEDWEGHDEWHGGILIAKCECDRCVAREVLLERESSDDEADEAEAKQVDHEDNFDNFDHDAEEREVEYEETRACQLIHDVLVAIQRNEPYKHLLVRAYDLSILPRTIDKLRELDELDTILGRKLIRMLQRLEAEADPNVSLPLFEEEGEEEETGTGSWSPGSWYNS